MSRFGAAWKARPSTTRVFLARFAVANVGAFTSFLPLLQILLPLKAAAIAPFASAQLLSAVAGVGAVAAGIANFGVGWLSDRTRERFGRAPWIVAGTLGVIMSYWLIWRAHEPGGLMLAFVAFQITFNMLFALLLALIPDRVPLQARGAASALFALGHPLAAALGGLAIGSLVTQEGPRYAVLSAIVCATILPFALTLRRGARIDEPLPRPSSAANLQTRLPRNFVLGWFARAGVMTAFSIAQLFLLLFVRSVASRAQGHAAEHGVALLGVVFGVVTSLAALAAGRWSDVITRRRPLVIAGAAAVAAGMGVMAFAPSWPVAVLGYAVFALGAGCHMAGDFAMMVELLPSRDRAARDLGLLNISNIVPQIAAPALATVVLGVPAQAFAGCSPPPGWRLRLAWYW